MSKSIAIIDTPKACESCIFMCMKYQHPFWSKEKPNTKGYYCQLDELRRVMETHITDDTFKPNWCPLKPYKESKD